MIIGILVTAAVLAAAGFGGALAVRSKQKYRAQNEILPGVESSAPASWAGAHTPEAKLHRRLKTAVDAARGNPRLVELGFAERLRQIETEAVAIDERLVAAAALPQRLRGDAVAKFEAPVTALEDAVGALAHSISVSDSEELLRQAVTDADIRLQALAEARAEVEQIGRPAPGTAAE